MFKLILRLLGNRGAVGEEAEPDIDPLAVEAYKEMEEGQKKPWEQEDQKTEESEDNPDEESKEESEPSEEEEETSKEEAEEEAEEKKEDEDEQTEEGKDEKEEEEVKGKEGEPDEKEIREIAVKEGLTIEEAKEKHIARKNIIEKYKNDPYEMAKALQSTQSAFDKLRNEVEEIKKAPKVDEIQNIAETEKQKLEKMLTEKADELIENYREKFPHKSENMDDEEILDEVKRDLLLKYEQHVERKRQEIKQLAEERREEYLQKIPEGDKEFIPEVKALLKQVNDVQILSPAFNIEDLVKWARGNRYTPEYIEKIKKEAYEKGRQEAKIIGKKAPIDTGKSTQKKAGAGVSPKTLNDAQKERAIEMFPDMPADKAFAEYVDLYKEELKKNPNFV